MVAAGGEQPLRAGPEDKLTRQAHRVAFYADIFYNSELSPSYWIPPENLDVEAIILGGDIHYSPYHLGEMLTLIRRTQHEATRIIVVPGNGEYVNQELHESRRQYRSAVAAVPGALFLDDDLAELPTGLRVIGSTLWSHVADDQLSSYSRMLADRRLLGVDNIRLGSRFLTLADTNELHARARCFIAEQLRKLSQPERYKTIVCTHFWPTLRPWTNAGDQPDLEWYQMTGSDLDELIAECGPRFWLCGHAHTTHQVTIGTTQSPRIHGPGTDQEMSTRISWKPTLSNYDEADAVIRCRASDRRPRSPPCSREGA
jgi:Icc-related predicted phosphoesterase